MISAFRDLQHAQSNVQIAQTTLIARLMGRSEGSARCLFTNTFPELGDLTQNVHQLAEVISGINDVYGKVCSNLNEQLDKIIAGQSMCDETTTVNLSKSCDTMRSDYDSKLADILKSRRKVRPEQEEAIMLCRHDYELARFDLVSKVNENDRNKKLIVTQILCSTFNIFRNFFQEVFCLFLLFVLPDTAYVAGF